MPESCPDMAVDGDELGVHYTVIIGFIVLIHRDICTRMARSLIPPLTDVAFSLSLLVQVA